MPEDFSNFDRLGRWSKVNILYYGACWPTNIGNAFIDYGSLYSIRAANRNAKIFFASELPRWLHSGNPHTALNLADLIEMEILVVSGMTFCDEFIRVEGPVLSSLSNRGVRIVFNGCGGATYDSSEIRNFQSFMGRLDVAGFISRDENAFKYCKQISQKVHSGIDCAFFLPDAFVPAPLRVKDYVVFNFDSMDEPHINNTENRQIIRAHHSYIDAFSRRHPGRMNSLLRGARRISVKASFNGARRDVPGECALISDIPEDYLNLYAGAYATYSDRIHSAIATLSYGNFARIFSDTPRAKVFDRVGVGLIRQQLVKLDVDRLAETKQSHISFLRGVL